jgi:hypothetical protein
MSRKQKPRGRKQKRNPGWFKKGHDARRSMYRFTAQDCRIGYLVAAIRHPELREWLRMKLRIYYHERKKHGEKEAGGERADNGGSRRRSRKCPERDAS